MEQRKPATSTIALQAVDRVLADVEGGDGERLAACFGAQLSGFALTTLPPAAHDGWRQIASLLRASADQPIPERTIHSMRSWPQSRVEALAGLLRGVRAVLERVENDRLEDEVRDSIRHHYL